VEQAGSLFWHLAARTRGSYRPPSKWMATLAYTLPHHSSASSFYSSVLCEDVKDLTKNFNPLEVVEAELQHGYLKGTKVLSSLLYRPIKRPCIQIRCKNIVPIYRNRC
jgi:hypothetical protein